MSTARRIATLVALIAATTLGTASAQDAQPPARPPVTGKWDTQLYGFVELDSIWDSTESFDEIAGNGIVARKGTYAYDNARLQLTPRNTRLGFRFASPEYEGVKMVGLLETDFFGTQPSNASEGAFFGSALLRIRHANLTFKTKYVDVMFGQSWQLLGWQPYFQPATVDLQGVPGELYSRQPQVRVSRSFASDPVTLDLAVAAARGQRDAAYPDLQGGVRVLFNGLKGLRTVGGTGTSVDPAAIGVSGVTRKFKIPSAAGADSSVSTDGWGYSLDAMLPIIPATLDRRDNGLTVHGSFQQGAGTADYYTGLNGGVGIPASSSAFGAGAGAIDKGLVADVNGELKAVRWRSIFVGGQYHLPAAPLWIAVNYSQMYSSNMPDLGQTATKVVSRMNWAEGSLFWDASPSTRLGLEYARFMQNYVDGMFVRDDRVQLSGWYVF